jgi:uncharacterized protein affecting Mg2+/Co2+ transport
MAKVEQIQEQLEKIVSEARSNEQDMRGVYDIETSKGERFQVEITEISAR